MTLKTQFAKASEGEFNQTPAETLSAPCSEFNARWSCRDIENEGIEFNILVLIQTLDSKNLELQISSLNKDLVLNLDNQLYPQSTNSLIAVGRSARGECRSSQLNITENSNWLGTQAAAQVNIRLSKPSKDSRLMNLVFESSVKKNANTNWTLPLIQKFNCSAFTKSNK